MLPRFREVVPRSPQPTKPPYSSSPPIKEIPFEFQFRRRTYQVRTETFSYVVIFHQNRKPRDPSFSRFVTIHRRYRRQTDILWGHS